MTEVGYIDMTGAVPAYRWYLTDHQGNVRVVADAEGNALQVNHYAPFGGDITLSNDTAVVAGGAGTSSSKYSGKEWNAVHGLYDFEARWYSPTLHRFTTMDPLCEQYYDISPYAYCANNPVNLVDPNGMWDVTIHVYHDRKEYGYGVAVVTDMTGK